MGDINLEKNKLDVFFCPKKKMRSTFSNHPPKVKSSPLQNDDWKIILIFMVTFQGQTCENTYQILVGGSNPSENTSEIGSSPQTFGVKL